MNEQPNERITQHNGIHLERGFDWSLPKCPGRNCLRTLPEPVETKRMYRGREVYGWRFWRWGTYKHIEQACACGFGRGKWERA